LLITQGAANANTLLFTALSLNFYALIAIGLALFVVVTGWNFGPMREAERRVTEEGKLLRDGAEPLVAEEVSTTQAKAGIPQRAVNMIIPILSMVITVPVVLWVTGDGSIPNGSGSQAVLWGVIVGLLVAVVMYRVQGIMTVKEATDFIIKGVQGLIPVVIVLSLAFAIAATTRSLGTGEFVADAARRVLNPNFVPSIVFLLACFIAFSTGTSWGTFAIMIPIVIPMVELIGLHPGLTVAAALGGGIFGDHCSPISDTTIVASMASATDHIDHVRTQLPYALLAAAGATTLFVVFGFVL
jgi:Na+/H+ antiporter NhaC